MKKLTSSILIFALIFSVLVFPGTFSASAAKTLEDYNDEYAALEEQLKQKESAFAEIQQDIADQEVILSELNGQIDSMQAQIDVLDDRIELLNVDITALNKKITTLDDEIKVLDEDIVTTEREISSSKEEIDSTFEALKERLRASYIAGEASNLELLLSADDVSSFLVRTEYIKRSAERDNKLINTLNTEIEKLSKLEEELKTQRTELSDKKVELDKEMDELESRENDLQSSKNIIETKKSALDAKKVKATETMRKLDESSDAYKAQVERLESEIEKTSDKIEELLKQSGVSSPTLNPGGWIWPVNTSGTYISSPYGYRYHPISGQYKMHTGIDISGGSIYQKPIVAAKSGTVTFTNYGYGGGYGNYVIIDHGGGYSTLYAHCDSLNVSTGQYVTQGQTIARVGSTGASTGPHLHFEVRINGSHTNPSNYVSQ